MSYIQGMEKNLQMDLLMNARFYIMHIVRGSLLLTNIFVYLCNDYRWTKLFFMLSLVILFYHWSCICIVCWYIKKSFLVGSFEYVGNTCSFLGFNERYTPWEHAKDIRCIGLKWLFSSTNSFLLGYNTCTYYEIFNKFKSKP